MDKPSPFTLTADLEREIFPHFEDQEGRVDHMYPDSKGYVTCGVGHLLAAPQDAIKLPFLHRKDGSLASAPEMIAAWHKVKDTARHYTELFLQQVDIDILLRTDCQRFLPILERTFGSVPNIPRPVVIALWDMVFNLGSFGAFPRFRLAIYAGDWAMAAEESKRQDIGDRRNEMVKALFLSAVAPPEMRSA